MGGRNPYFDELASVELPAQRFSITFLPMNVTVEVDPERIPYSDTGLPGSILDVALAHGIDVDHACGGVCACSTCHAVVREGGETLSEMSDAEEDQLSYAPGLTPESRLSCQAVANGSRNLVVYIPNWNRNLVRESH
jgi:2Fe-2S ferredoxin